MVKSTIYAALAASAVFAMQCGTAEKSTVLKDPQGKVIGRYDTMSDSEARASFDTNQNGISERVASYKDKKIVGVEYFDDKSGSKTKAVGFKEGKPETVKVFNKDGKEVRGDVTLDTAKNQAKEVVLPARSKKVTFNGDGTMTVAPVENK
jgi:hypothetical protein